MVQNIENISTLWRNFLFSVFLLFFLILNSRLEWCRYSKRKAESFKYLWDCEEEINIQVLKDINFPWGDLGIHVVSHISIY